MKESVKKEIMLLRDLAEAVDSFLQYDDKQYWRVVLSKRLARWMDHVHLTNQSSGRGKVEAICKHGVVGKCSLCKNKVAAIQPLISVLYERKILWRYITFKK